MIRVMIVDDCNIVREGVRSLLEKAAEIEVIKCVCNGKEAIEEIKENLTKPDVVIMDLVMPVMGGIRATEIINKLFDQIKVIVLSDINNPETISCALAAGAKGYIFKSHIEELFSAIQVINEGYVLVEDEIMDNLLEKQKRATISLG